MARVNASKSSTLNFNESFISYESSLIANRHTFRWESELGPFKLYHEVKGSGFTYGNNGLPTGGTARSVGIQSSGTGGSFDPKVTITDVSVAMTDLLPGGSKAVQNRAFWGTLMSGDDRVVAGGDLTAYGDVYAVRGGSSVSGGNDRFIGKTHGELTDVQVKGDAEIVSGGTLEAGNDSFDFTSKSDFRTMVIGDVGEITGGTVNGGNDTITYLSDLGATALIGDAGTVDNKRSTLNAGDDTIEGGDARDTISGDIKEMAGGTLRAGDDTLTGGKGSDKLFGDVEIATGGRIFLGNDTIHGGVGEDVIYGDVGTLGDNVVVRGKGNDRLFGDDGDDLIFGGNGRDTIAGGRGDDTISGGKVRDTIRGGIGDDKIEGDERGDFLIGGGGSDTFVYNSIRDSLLAGKARDVIRDFTKGADTIDLSKIDARSGGGNQSFDFIGTKAFSGTKGELRYERADNRTVVQADVDGDGSADFAINLDGSIRLTVNDFDL